MFLHNILRPLNRVAQSAGCCSVLPSLLDFKPEQYGLPAFEDMISGVVPLEPVWKLKGKVVKGFGRGSKELGIPTANLDAASLQVVMATVDYLVSFEVAGYYRGSLAAWFVLQQPVCMQLHVSTNTMHGCRVWGYNINAPLISDLRMHSYSTACYRFAQHRLA